MPKKYIDKINVCDTIKNTMGILKKSLQEVYDLTENLANRTNLPDADHMMYSYRNWNIKQLLKVVKAIEKFTKKMYPKQKQR